MDEWLTIRQAAEIAKMNENSIRQAILQKRLSAQKFGNVWAIRRNDFDMWLNRADAHKPGVKRGSKRKTT